MVFIPGISQKKPLKLERRKGGGGGGRGSRSSGSSSSGSSKSSSGGRTSPVTIGSTSRTSSSTSSGGGPLSTIPQGQFFSGRAQGGGTRSNIYGNRSYLSQSTLKVPNVLISMYGSGYPGSPGVGVAGHGFPYYYWPVVFGSVAVLGTQAYLNTRGEVSVVIPVVLDRH